MPCRNSCASYFETSGNVVPMCLLFVDNCSRPAEKNMEIR